MSGTGAIADKRRLAALTLVQLSDGAAESGERAYQIVISPSNISFPKRTVTIGLDDAHQFAVELEIVAALIRADLTQRA